MYEVQRSRIATGVGGLDRTDASVLERVPGGVFARSVLHVGCVDESLCLRAAEAGAARITGVFASPLGLNAARRRLPAGAPVPS